MTATKWQKALLATAAAVVVALSMGCTTKSSNVPAGTGPGGGTGNSPPHLFQVLPAESCGTAGSILTLLGQFLTPSNDPIPGVTINGVPATVLSVAAGSGAGSSDVVTVQGGAQPGTIPPTGLFVDVTITNDNGSDTLRAAVKILPGCSGAPLLVSISPGQGPRTGGTVVTLDGDQLACVTSVEFIGNQGSGDLTGTLVGVNSDQEILVKAPVTATSQSGEQWDIRVTSHCGVVTLRGAWVYTGGTSGGPGAVPDALSIVLNSGSAAGGDKVTIYGNDLGNATTINFGGVTLVPATGSGTPTTGVFLPDFNGDLVIPSVPASLAGPSTTIAVNVTVSNANGADTTPVAYTYIGQGAPACTSIVPASGSKAGGFAVTITGTGMSAVDGVLFGGVAATNLAHPDPTRVVCTAPAYTAAPIDVDVKLTVGGLPVSTCAGAFRYLSDTQTFQATSITPTSGLQTGGEAITIAGTGLDAATGVTICTVPAVIVAASPTVIQATTGAYSGTVPNECDVTVTTSAGQSSTLHAAEHKGYTYLPITPDATAFDAAGARTAPAAGGPAFRLTGTKLFGVSKVSFSGIAGPSEFACNLQVQSDTEVTGTVPAYSTPGGPFPATVSVVAQTDGGADPTPVPFTYYDNPRGTAASPNIVDAGTVVILQGTNFQGPDGTAFVSTVTLSNSGVTNPGTVAAGKEILPVQFVILDANRIQFTFPAAVNEDYFDIKITTPLAGSAPCVTNYSQTLLRGVFFGTTPPIASVTPSSGRFTGGTKVVITGQFNTPVRTVTIGGVSQPIQAQTTACVAITTVGVAAAAAGVAQDVVVTNQAGSSIPLTGAYTFIPDPVLQSVDTNTTNCGLLSSSPLPAAQGQTFAIHGTNMIGVTEVDFKSGGSSGTTTAVTPSSVSATMVVVQAPAPPASAGAGAPPLVDLVVIAGFTASPACGSVATATDAPFTHTLGGALQYQAAPVVTAMAPVTGGAGTTVTLTGTDLRNAGGSPVFVSFGANPATNVSPNSAGTSLTCTAPAGAEGQTVQVTVSTCQGTALAGSFKYPCVTQPRITNVAPSSGSASGGTAVAITGTNLLSADGTPVQVLFGANAANVDVATSTATQLNVTAPAGTAGTAVPIKVTTCAGTVTATQQFSYGCVAPTITSIAPAQGTVGTSVVITGNNLANPDGSAVTVSFGGTNGTVTASTPTSVTVSAPAGAGSVTVTVTTCGGTGTAGQQFQYCAAPTFTAFAPQTGPAGTSVVITGTGLVNPPPDNSPASVTFGGVSATSTIANPAGTSLTATVPAGSGSVQIKLTTCGGTITVGTYLYCTAPAITTFAPTEGATGLQVHIIGTGFLGADNAPPRVMFGAALANVISATDTSIFVFVPPSAGGPASTPAVPVSVQTCGGTAFDSGTLFQYCNTPVVTGVNPPNGPAGTTVIITGTDFLGADGAQATVTFGTVAASSVVNITATTITAVVPPGPIGSIVNVQVHTCGGSSGALPPSQYTYSTSTTCVPPVITSLNPAAGPVGLNLVIMGTFLVGADGAQPTVTIGALPVVTFYQQTSGQLTVVVPGPASANPVAVKVTTCGGSATAGTTFTYCSIPTVTGVSPPTGAAGNNVVITGTNFLGADGAIPVVLFGTQPATVLNRTATTITVSAPAGFPQGTTVNVQVSTCGGPAGNTPPFTYNSAGAGCVAPTITDFLPAAGGTGTQVVIHGTNLIGADGVTASVAFGGLPAAVITATATQLVATAPAGAPGSVVSIRATTCGGTAQSPSVFTFCSLPTITGFVPPQGPVGTSVTISGTNFLGADGQPTDVAFGTATATVLSATATQLVVAAPAGISPGTSVNVRVNTCGGTATSAATYLYQAGTPTCTPPVVSGIAPTSGIAASTQVTITGSNMVGADGAPPVVKFGNIGAAVITYTATQIVAIAPAGGGAAVSVTTCGGQAFSPVPFTYCAAPTLAAGMPTPSSGTNGTTVTLDGTNLIGADGAAPVVKFGVTPATIISQTGTRLVVSAPAGIPAGTAVAVTVSTCGGTVSAPLTFTYNNSGIICVPPVISGVAPGSGLAGTQVTISGSNLVGADLVAPVVKFGTFVAAILTSTPAQIVVTAPAGPVGAVGVSVTTCGGVGNSPAPFQYCLVPTVTSINPNVGALGTPVTLGGTNMLGADGAAPVVKFGTTPATIISATAASIQVTAPAGVPGGTSVPVTVTTCGGTATAPSQFTYTGGSNCSPPVITGIVPVAGPTGIQVTITGTNLLGADNNPSVVKFAAVVAAQITSTATQFVVTAPAGPAGSVSVSITTCGGTGNSPVPFTYCVVPSITNFNPASGQAGTTVTITGLSMVGADGNNPTVKFGTSPATLISATATSVIVSAPAGIPQNTSVPITVTTCGGTATSAGTFLYSTTSTCVPPVVTSIAPSAGIAGTQVTIAGSNLIGADLAAPVVKFGATVAPLVTSTPTQLVVTTPAGAGSVSVSVTTCGGTGNSPTPFTYCTAPTITSLLPTNGPAGINVTIGGTNLVGANGLDPVVTFGARVAAIVDETPAQLIVTAPSGFANGTTVSVKVTTCGGTATSGTSFQYLSSTVCVPPTVTNIAPRSGPNGTQVTLTGTNLIGNDGNTGTVRFGATVVPPGNVLGATNTSLVVLVPGGAGSVTVSVTTCGGVANCPTPYVYCNNPPSVTQLEDAVGNFYPPYPAHGTIADPFYIHGSFLSSADGDPPVVKFGTGTAALLDVRADRIAVAIPGQTDGGTPFFSGDIVTISVHTCGGTVNQDTGANFLVFQFN